MDQMFHGLDIAKKVLETIQHAENHIYIMEFLLFNVKNVYFDKENVKLNLLELLKRKSTSDIEIKIIISNPKGLKKNERRKQFESIEFFATNHIPVMVCDHVHYKFLLIDNGLLHGSANLTFTGLSGIRDEMVYTENEKLIMEFSTLFLKRWSKSEKACSDCKGKCKKF